MFFCRSDLACYGSTAGVLGDHSDLQRELLCSGLFFSFGRSEVSPSRTSLFRFGCMLWSFNAFRLFFFFEEAKLRLNQNWEQVYLFIWFISLR